MSENNQNIPVEPKFKIKVSPKLENFWYHYKWHTIVGIFIVIAAAILVTQLFTKTEYDVNIIYAGEKAIATTSLSGDGVTELSTITRALEMAGEDYNNDKKVRFNLHNLCIMSSDEYQEAVKDITDPLQKSKLESEIQTNRQTLNDLIYSGYFLYLFSEDIFREYDGEGDAQLFADIGDYIKDGGEYTYASDRGIYLSSLEIYKTTDLSLLPPDTVICIRLPGVFDSTGEGSKYDVSEKLLRSILAYGE
ncbi:MAG: hypothetical protein J6D20_06815 [Clostridia bacterium]|nr:hypothetical protein [Clostridia bacterium]